MAKRKKNRIRNMVDRTTRGHSLKKDILSSIAWIWYDMSDDAL